MKRFGILCALGAFAGLMPAANRNAGEKRFFDRHVAPILVKRCLACHNQQLKNGNLSFEDPESLLAEGAHGPAIVPGKPEASLLILVLRHDGEIQMPPGPKLPEKELRILSDWGRRGAVWGNRLNARHPRREPSGASTNPRPLRAGARA